MDNLGVRLPVDATAKSKFKSARPHELIAVSLAGHHKQKAEGTERKNLF